MKVYFLLCKTYTVDYVITVIRAVISLLWVAGWFFFFVFFPLLATFTPPKQSGPMWWGKSERDNDTFPKLFLLTFYFSSWTGFSLPTLSFFWCFVPPLHPPPLMLPLCPTLPSSASHLYWIFHCSRLPPATVVDLASAVSSSPNTWEKKKSIVLRVNTIWVIYYLIQTPNLTNNTNLNQLATVIISLQNVRPDVLLSWWDNDDNMEQMFHSWILALQKLQQG